MKKNKKIRKVSPLTRNTVLFFLNIFFKKKYKINIIKSEEVNSLKPPYVILANHQGFWDPFLLGNFIDVIPYYVTSDAVFRSKVLSLLMGFFGAIPKTKSKTDIDALKHIFEMRDLGRCIGIFPEGQRTWDGCTLPVIESTAKLVRMLNIPVVTVLFKGGYLAHPRWRTSINRGELTIEYSLLFKEGEIGILKKSQVFDKLTKALEHDEIEYQEQKKLKWENSRAAENIEQVLFICPNCESYRGFSSSRNSFKCKACNSEWQIDQYQKINNIKKNSNKNKPSFSNVRDWDHWQLEKLYSRLDKKFNSDEIVLSDDNLVFKTGFKNKNLKTISKGSIQLRNGCIIFISKEEKEIKRMDVSRINGINVQNNEILDFYYDHLLYTVNDPDRHFPAYKWWRAVSYIQKH